MQMGYNQNLTVGHKEQRLAVNRKKLFTWRIALQSHLFMHCTVVYRVVNIHIVQIESFAPTCIHIVVVFHVFKITHRKTLHETYEIRDKDQNSINLQIF